MALNMNDIRKIIKEEVDLSVKKHLKNIVNEAVIAILVEAKTKQIVNENSEFIESDTEYVERKPIKNTNRNSLSSLVKNSRQTPRQIPVQNKAVESILEIATEDPDKNPINLSAVPETVLNNIFNKDYKSMLRNMNESAQKYRSRLPKKIAPPEITPEQ